MKFCFWLEELHGCRWVTFERNETTNFHDQCFFNWLKISCRMLLSTRSYLLFVRFVQNNRKISTNTFCVACKKEKTKARYRDMHVQKSLENKCVQWLDCNASINQLDKEPSNMIFLFLINQISTKKEIFYRSWGPFYRLNLLLCFHTMSYQISPASRWKVFLTLTKLQQTDRVLSTDDKKTLKIQPENSRETGLYREESVNDSTQLNSHQSQYY